jgi:large subunit ribosomal protein L9
MADVEVILTQDDSKLGERGKVVKVSGGHARNFLIPSGRAVLATSENLRRAEQAKLREEKKKERLKADTQELAKRIEAASLTIEMQVGEGEKVFGSVTSHEIQTRLSQLGIPVEKKDLHLEDPIKQLGAFAIDIHLHPEVNAKLKLWVVKKKT